MNAAALSLASIYVVTIIKKNTVIAYDSFCSSVIFIYLTLLFVFFWVGQRV